LSQRTLLRWLTVAGFAWFVVGVAPGCPGSAKRCTYGSCPTGSVCNEETGQCTTGPTDGAADAPLFDLARGDRGVSDILPLACKDGVKNGSETDVDCGGPSCAPCAVGKSCQAHRDCKPGLCPSGSCVHPASCAEIHAQHATAASGVFTVSPTSASSPISVWCEMSIDGGGWTMVQRTVWSWSSSKKLLTGFTAFYETTVGDPAQGAAFRVAGTHWLSFNKKKEMLVAMVPRKLLDGDSCSPLHYKGTGGTLAASPATKSFTLTGMSSTVSLTSSTSISTTDSGPSSSCVATSYGVPWFYGGCCGTCPTFQSSYWLDEPHPMVAISIASTKDLLGKTTTDVCGSDWVVASLEVYGLNAMEIYLR
jgi:hypothetical protein